MKLIRHLASFLNCSRYMGWPKRRFMAQNHHGRPFSVRSAFATSIARCLPRWLCHRLWPKRYVRHAPEEKSSHNHERNAWVVLARLVQQTSTRVASNHGLDVVLGYPPPTRRICPHLYLRRPFTISPPEVPMSPLICRRQWHQWQWRTNLTISQHLLCQYTQLELQNTIGRINTISDTTLYLSSSTFPVHTPIILPRLHRLSYLRSPTQWTIPQWLASRHPHASYLKIPPCTSRNLAYGLQERQ